MIMKSGNNSSLSYILYIFISYGYLFTGMLKKLNSCSDKVVFTFFKFASHNSPYLVMLALCRTVMEIIYLAWVLSSKSMLNISNSECFIRLQKHSQKVPKCTELHTQ